MNLNLCTPALVYLIVSLVGTLLNYRDTPAKINAKSSIVSLAVIALITYLLNEVCIRYSVRYSWYVLAGLFIIPLFFALITIIMLGMMIKKG